MTRQLRILVIQRLIPEYRVPFFRYLNQLSDLKVTVVYGKPRRNSSVRNAKSMNGFVSRMIKTTYFIKNFFCYQPSIVFDVLRKKYDIIIAEFSIAILSNVIAAFLCRIFGVKFIWWGCGYDSLVRSKDRLYIFKKWLLRLLIWYADAVIAYSETAKCYYECLGSQSNKIFIAYNSIDNEYLLEIRNRLLLKPKECDAILEKHHLVRKVTILFVGRLIEEKKIRFLLNAFGIVKKIVSNTALIIVGDGPQRKQLEAEANNISTDIIFTGSIYDRKTLGKYFSIAKVFVLPGLGGLAINEAMCFGLPVVCARADGTELQLIEDGVNGYIVKKSTPDVFAQAILKIIRNEEVRISMGKRSLHIIRHKVNIGAMLNGFRQAIAYVSDTRIISTNSN